MSQMKHGDGHLRWASGGAVAASLVSEPACLRIDTDHCMFSGGDQRCSSLACVAAIEGHALRSPDLIGCGELDVERSDTYVHVEYGLLLAVTNDEGVVSSESRPRTVEDVLRSRLGEGSEPCPLGGDEVREAVAGTAAIWHRLEHLGVRKAEAYLQDEEAQAIEVLNAAVDELLESCTGSTGTSTGMTGTASVATGETSNSEDTSGPPACSHEECLARDPSRPICNDDDRCVSCGEAGGDRACEAADPALPACFTTGECVECTTANTSRCTGGKPNCNYDDHICEPCSAHEQCGEAACNLFTGACLPANSDSVVHVGPEEQFTTLGEAVAATGEAATIVVHAGPLSYDESLTVVGDRTLAFLAAEVGPLIIPPQWISTSGDEPQLTVTLGATVLMDGLRLSSNFSSAVPGLQVSAGRAWIDRSRIILNNGDGIVADYNADLVLRNCFVGDGNLNDFSALVVNGATARVVYTTLAAGFVSSALTCDSEADVAVRNSLLVSREILDDVMCTSAVIEHSAAGLYLGGMNTGLGIMIDPEWFVNYNGGDLHLAAEHPRAIDTTARWNTGDPPTDIDGHDRPNTPNTPDFAGADRISR